MKTALVVFAHGSRVAEANESVEKLTAEVAREGGFDLFEAAFLDLAKPDLPGAVACLAARGATRVVIVPHFVILGVHLQRDLPRMVEELSRSYPGVRIEVKPPLEGHPGLRSILLDRALGR